MLHSSRGSLRAPILQSPVPVPVPESTVPVPESPFYKARFSYRYQRALVLPFYRARFPYRYQRALVLPFYRARFLVPVPESTGGSGTVLPFYRARFLYRYQRALVLPFYRARFSYRYQRALVVPVPCSHFTKPGSRTGTREHWWFRYRAPILQSPVPVPIPESTGGSGTVLPFYRARFPYRYQRALVVPVPFRNSVTGHLSDTDICPTRTFVRHRHLSDNLYEILRTFVRHGHLSENLTSNVYLKTIAHVKGAISGDYR